MSRQKKVSITHEIYKMCKQSRFVFFFMIIVPVFIGLYFFYIGVKEIKLANESTEPSGSGERNRKVKPCYTIFNIMEL